MTVCNATVGNLSSLHLRKLESRQHGRRGEGREGDWTASWLVTGRQFSSSPAPIQKYSKGKEMGDELLKDFNEHTILRHLLPRKEITSIEEEINQQTWHKRCSRCRITSHAHGAHSPVTFQSSLCRSWVFINRRTEKRNIFQKRAIWAFDFKMALRFFGFL